MHTTSSPAEVSPSTTEPSPGMLVTSQSRRIIKSSSSIEMRTPPISLLEDVVARHQNNNSSSHHLQDFTSEGNNSPTVLGFRSRKIYDASCAPSLAAGLCVCALTTTDFKMTLPFDFKCICYIF
eukprot:380792_1